MLLNLAIMVGTEYQVRGSPGRARGKPVVESFRLETISDLHPVATQVFVPFAITRLQERPEATEAVSTVALRGIEEQPTEDRNVL
jgi:hypothetical protein